MYVTRPAESSPSSYTCFGSTPCGSVPAQHFQLIAVMLRRRRVLAPARDLEILRLARLDRTGEVGRILVHEFVVIKEIGLDVDAASGLLAVVRRRPENDGGTIVLHFFHIAEPDILNWTPCGQHLVG